jgi:hypothetical protein
VNEEKRHWIASLTLATTLIFVLTANVEVKAPDHCELRKRHWIASLTLATTLISLSLRLIFVVASVSEAIQWRFLNGALI